MKASVPVLAAVTVPGDTVSVPVPSAHVTVTTGDGLTGLRGASAVGFSAVLKVAGPEAAGTVASL
jgi:hypothetical protein